VPPLISIVMPTYNQERYLKEAIESILNQTFQDFEFIIIIDNSTDGTDAVLKSFQQKDDRIRIYREEKKGLIPALNKGCYLARGKYIARMDSDDISLPKRLEMQVKYLEAHPEIAVLGTGVRYIDETGKPGKSELNPIDPKIIGLYLYFANCIVHPSVLMRREMVESLGFYSSAALHAEDYDLWARASQVTKIANLQEVLLHLRMWQGSTSQLYQLAQKQAVIKIRRSMISGLLGPGISANSIVTPSDLANPSSIGKLQQIGKVADLMLKLYTAYRKVNSLNLEESLTAAHILEIFFRGITKEIINANDRSQ
jgi:glycosyltransferase involved in cell wall biosynthesis